jgi:hypothetical protein
MFYITSSVIHISVSFSSRPNTVLIFHHRPEHTRSRRPESLCHHAGLRACRHVFLFFLPGLIFLPGLAGPQLFFLAGPTSSSSLASSAPISSPSLATLIPTSYSTVTRSSSYSWLSSSVTMATASNSSVTVFRSSVREDCFFVSCDYARPIQLNGEPILVEIA